MTRSGRRLPLGTRQVQASRCIFFGLELTETFPLLPSALCLPGYSRLRETRGTLLPNFLTQATEGPKGSVLEAPGAPRGSLSS